MNEARPFPIRRLFTEHPAVLLSALYFIASTIGMLFSWDFLRRFGINVFLYAEIGDFLIASLREPLTWLLVLAAVGLAAADNAFSRWVDRKSTSRWLRWYTSKRYRALNYLVAVMLTVFFIDVFATSKARAVYSGDGESVAVTLAGEQDSKSALLLGTTGQFIFLYDRASNTVAVHPHENVLSIAVKPPQSAE